MSSEEVPRELREVAETVLSEFHAACGDSAAESVWLAEYEVLELRVELGGAGIEVYLPRPLLEDLVNLNLVMRKQVLDDLRGIPARAQDGEGARWLLREQGKARALARRPFA